MSSAQQLMVNSLRCDIDNLRHLSTTSSIVSDISRFIHALQRERGASTIYLVSQGKRFEHYRYTYIDQSRAAETLMRQRLEMLGKKARPQAAARLLRRIASVWLALDQLNALRDTIDTLTISADAATQAFNHLIGGLLAIVFEAADTSADLDITRALVAIFHLMQGKELAGQERACGAFGFTQGYFDNAHRELLNKLVKEQQHCFDTFLEFTTQQTRTRWHQTQSQPFQQKIHQLRHTICQQADREVVLDKTQSETWYALTTQRIDSIKTLEDELTAALVALCHEKIDMAKQDLNNVQAVHHEASSTPCELLLALGATQLLGDLTANALTSPLSRSLIELTHAHSSRLLSLSDELESTRKDLRDRKLIERAKGLIMSHQSITEEEAHRFLRKTSMDQSKSMVEMAQSILNISAMLQRKET